MIVLRKCVLKDGYEYLDPIDLLDESDEKTFKTYLLAKACCDVLNYFIENLPDAFGNAPYARLDGFLHGYLAGAGMELRQTDDVWDIIKGKRIVLRVEVPRLPTAYYEALKDNAKTWNEVFG